MSTQHRRSRRPHHNRLNPADADRNCKSPTDFDPANFAALRLKLTNDGWYIDGDEPGTFEDTQAAANAVASHRTSQQTDSGPLVAIVPSNDDTGPDAEQAAKAIRPIIGSFLGPGNRRINLLIFDPRTDRNG